MIYLASGEETAFLVSLRSVSLRSVSLPSNVEVITASPSPKNVFAAHFPVNLLRNVGLLNVRTSHALVLDADAALAGSLSLHE